MNTRPAMLFNRKSPLYNTKRWRALRWSILVRDRFTCQMCGKIEGNTSLLVCDHTEPHRGDPEKFWAGPFQTLCKSPCHDSLKQREENGRPVVRIGEDGWPV